MNNNDKSIPNVPDNYQNWIEIVVMAIIIYTLQLHYNVLSGPTGEKPRYNGRRYIQATVVQNL